MCGFFTSCAARESFALRLRERARRRPISNADEFRALWQTAAWELGVRRCKPSWLVIHNSRISPFSVWAPIDALPQHVHSYTHDPILPTVPTSPLTQRTADLLWKAKDNETLIGAIATLAYIFDSWEWAGSVWTPLLDERPILLMHSVQGDLEALLQDAGLSPWTEHDRPPRPDRDESPHLSVDNWGHALPIADERMNWMIPSPVTSEVELLALAMKDFLLCLTQWCLVHVGSNDA